MSFSRKQALNELLAMFPDFDRDALDSLLRANSNTFTNLNEPHLDNLMDQTIESILAITSSSQQESQETSFK